MRPRNFIDLAGQRFGMLIAQESVGYRPGGTVWKCVCDCGRTTEAYSQNLRRGRTMSCGCYRVTAISMSLTRHGHARKGAVTSEHRIWRAMIDRCWNPHNKSFRYYGALGVQVCERWLRSFENFLADMGERPRGTSLDRVDNDRGYEPDNCRWATPTTQVRNSRRTDLNVVAVCLIRHMKRRGASCAAIGHAFGISRSQVSKISKRLRWNDLFHSEAGHRTPVAPLI